MPPPGSRRGAASADDGVIVVDATASKYAIVVSCATARGWRVIEGAGTDDEEENGGEVRGPVADADLRWQDTSVAVDAVMRMASWQRVNHFPGMACLHTKSGLARTLKRLAAVLPDAYAFAPRTWVLPDEWPDLLATQFPQAQGGGGDDGGESPAVRASQPRRSLAALIVKPAASCQGRGIYITRSLADLDPRAHQVAQVCLARPALVDGLKFDLRIYVLVTTVAPLRVWMHDDGLARFATTPYAPDPTDRISL